jgi:hypothetical protein
MAGASDKIPQRLRPVLRNAAVFAIYAALTVIVTWPVAGRVGSHVPGRDGDTFIHLWTFQWVKDALLAGQDPFYTRLLFFPSGAFLYSHNFAWVNIAIWLPLQALLGTVTAYSIAFLVVIVLNGFAGYLLTRELTGSSLVGFVGGLILAFWPYSLSHHDHPNLIFIAWIPLALLYLKRFLDHWRRRDFILSAVFIALIGITRWQLLIMASFIIGLYLLYRIISDKLYRLPHRLGSLLLLGLVALLIMLPFLLPVLTAMTRETVPTDLFVDYEPDWTDLLAFVLPNRYHPLWGDAVTDVYDRFPVRTAVPFVGYMTLLLVIIGAVFKWPKAQIWLLAALMYLVLAIGPTLQINGRIFDLPMPYSLIADSFIIQMIRRPTRFSVMLSIPFAILVAFGVAVLLDRLRSKWASYALVAVVSLLILGEYFVTYSTLPLSTPAWYSELAKEPGEFGLFIAPISSGQTEYKTYMVHQFVHGKPLVQGHVSRIPPESTTFISRVPLLRKVRHEKIRVLADEMVNVTEQLRWLADVDIRYLILYKPFLSESDINVWKEWLGHDPVHEDLDLVVYKTDPTLGHDFTLANELTTGPDGELEIGLIRASIIPSTTIPGGELQVALNWYAGSDVNRDYDICLGLAGEDGQFVQSVCEPLAPLWPTSNWQAGELFYTNYAFTTSAYLDAGAYPVALTLVDGVSGEQATDVIPVGGLDYAALPRVFTEPAPAAAAGIMWDDAIFLPGYDFEFPHADSLVVHVYWGARRRMDDSYTNFFHLIDPETGEVVAQADVIPRGWTYPTNWWEQGEWVEDTVWLSLEGVPPGEYALYTGWYDTESGERLPAYSAAGEAYPDRSAFLTVVERPGHQD